MRSRVWATAAAVAAAAAGISAPAAAQTSEARKTFTVAVGPAEVVSGPEQTFAVRIANTSEKQRLGSVDLRAPSYGEGDAATGFELLGASVGRGTATIADGVVRLRSLDLAPGAATVAQVVADTTSATGTWAWTAQGKQANDFNGTGNDVLLDAAGSSLTTTVAAPVGGVSRTCPEEAAGPTQSCRLSVTWVGEGAFPPPPDPAPVATGAMMRSAAAAGGTTQYAITLAVEASAVAPGNSGDLTLGLPASRQLNCLGFAEWSPVTGVFTGPTQRDKTVEITVDAAVALGEEPPGVCYAGPTPAAFDPAYPPSVPFAEGASVFFPAVLGPCPEGTAAVLPCLRSADEVGGDWHYVVEVPATVVDPYVRP